MVRLVITIGNKTMALESRSWSNWIQERVEEVKNVISSYNISPLPDIPLCDHHATRDESKLLVPGYRQLDDYSCGAIAAWSVLRTFHPKARFKKFYSDCNVDTDGTNEIQVTAALRKNRIGVSRRDDMTFAQVAKTIDKGFPIIASVEPKGCEAHFLVIYGVGMDPKRLLTCNNFNRVALHGREEYTWKEWSQIWDKSSRYLVCWGK